MAQFSSTELAAAHAAGGQDAGYDERAARHVSVARVLGLFRPYAGRIALVLLLIALASAAGLAAPFRLREIVDVALPRGDLPLLAALAASLIGLAAIGAAIGVLQAFVTAKVGQAVMHDLRVAVYAHLQSLPLGFFAATRAGDIQSRIASDIGALQALDTATERAVVEALAESLAHPAKPRTTITIAHRLSTVRRADQIVVLDRGTVVENGTHESLLARDGAYVRLVREAA